MVEVYAFGAISMVIIGLSLYGLFAKDRPDSFSQTHAPSDYRSAGDAESDEDYLARMRYQEFSEQENTALVELVQQDGNDKA